MKTYNLYLKLSTATVLAALWSVSAIAADTEGAPATEASAQLVREKADCTKNLKRIYEAIQSYRRDHKQLPNWLSDLVPQYLADPSVLICPITKRAGKAVPYTHLADPNMACSYMYEFCDGEAGVIYQAGKMKMRELKSLQMALIGGDTPMLRCLLHDPVLNVGFGGKFFESPLNWESLFQDVVDQADLWPAKLLARFSIGGDLNAEVRPAPPVSVPDSEPGYMSLMDKTAPDFTKDLLEGGSFELAAEKGKHTVILDFWATWCGPCRSALPILTEVSEQFKDRGVILRAVDLREKPEVVLDYLKRSELKLTVVLDKEGSVATLFKVNGIPQTVIIGQDGNVRRIHVGYSPDLKQRLTEDLEAVLAGQKAEAQADK